MGQPLEAAQPEAKRIKNFREVSLGYPKKLALSEAARCPQCADPVCMPGCPLGINIPGFIRSIRENNLRQAFEIIRRENPYPAICGRLCSAPCEKACVLTDEEAPIGIRALERYASEFGRPKQKRKHPVLRKGKKIAVVGSGPAGLSAAAILAEKGYQVTVFESLDRPGGVLRYGIPEFRIPQDVLNAEIEDLRLSGVQIITNFFIGQTATLTDLFDESFAAVLLAVGAGIPKFMDIPGANLGGVYYGEEFLMRTNLMVHGKRKEVNFPLGKKVAVIGAGNTALDCARTAVRLDREVKLIFRGTEEDMYVRSQERDLGKGEGVKMEPLTMPVRILADQDNFVAGLKCRRLDFADPHDNGDWELMPVPDSDFVMDAETVIIAVGHQPNAKTAVTESGVALNEDGTVKVNDETMMSSQEAVFACGNAVTNAGPIVGAMASGKKAAREIDKYLQG